MWFQVIVHIPVDGMGPDCPGNLKKNRSRVCRFQDIQRPDGPEDYAGNLKKKIVAVYAGFKIVAGYAGFKIL
jgi:hypothetical protein